jgi:hypothetical protein
MRPRRPQVSFSLPVRLMGAAGTGLGHVYYSSLGNAAGCSHFKGFPPRCSSDFIYTRLPDNTLRTSCRNQHHSDRQQPPSPVPPDMNRHGLVVSVSTAKRSNLTLCSDEMRCFPQHNAFNPRTMRRIPRSATRRDNTNDALVGRTGVNRSRSRALDRDRPARYPHARPQSGICFCIRAIIIDTQNGHFLRSAQFPPRERRATERSAIV